MKAMEEIKNVNEKTNKEIQELVNNWALEVIIRLIKEGKLEDFKEEECPTQT